MTLASLERGRKYVIQNVKSPDPDIQRLMVLGLVEGAEIELVPHVRQCDFLAARASPALRSHHRRRR
jgi:Fe2+ transport system protein FeoA